MIRYRLKCEKRHEFEAWFADSAAYDRQARRGQISCPKCGTANVEKALMTPSIAKRTRRKRVQKAPPPAPNGLQFQPAQPAVQQVQIQFAPAANIKMSVRGGMGLTLVDDKGQPVQPTGFQQQITRGPNGISTQLTLTFPPQKGEAAKLVFSGSRSATLEIPFKLKDVPLP